MAGKPPSKGGKPTKKKRPAVAARKAATKKANAKNKKNASLNKRRAPKRAPEQQSSRLPGANNVLEILHHIGEPLTHKDICQAFALSGDARIAIKELLHEMVDNRQLERHGRRYAPPEMAQRANIPSVTICDICDTDDDGELLVTPLDPEVIAALSQQAQPLVSNSERPSHGRSRNESSRTNVEFILVIPPRYRGPTPAEGRQCLASLSPEDGSATLVRVLPEKKAQRFLGMFTTTQNNPHQYGIVEPINRKQRLSVSISKEHALNAEDGQLVWALPIGNTRRGMSLVPGKIEEILGSTHDAGAYSSMALHEHDIPLDFPEDVVAEAEASKPPVLGNRTDLRDLPLVTIDGEDARDFDDAVFARPHPDHKNDWELTVAIADVAHYVRTGSALDVEALERGNSVYFPDRVVPMLPEALSNGLCSLVPHEDRYCLAMRMRIDNSGTIKHKQLLRGLMRSHARLTYNQVQAALDGAPDDLTKPLLETTLEPLHKLYKILDKNRLIRGALDLDLPEWQIEMTEDKKIKRISQRARYDSHKLIEECMIAANIAAAELLREGRSPALHRNHDTPEAGKLGDLGEFLESLGIDWKPARNVQPGHFNELFKKVPDDLRAIVQIATLRAQMQANYGPDQLGHFGLALSDYTHFTSPIRRYSDLIVHRALIKQHRQGDDGLQDSQIMDLDGIGEHISMTERRAMLAERDAKDRYLAHYMQERVGATFRATISGVATAGLFVTTVEEQASGLIPMRSLSDDYYTLNQKQHCVVGRKKRKTYQLGQLVEVQLVEATAISGSLRFELTNMTDNRRTKSSPDRQDARPNKHRDSRDRGEKKKTTPKHKRKMIKSRRED